MKILISLVSRGANIHVNNNYAVRLASYYGQIEVVQYLVSQGANIHAYNSEAVRLASEKGHLDVVRYLISQGADIHAKDNYAVRSASHNKYFAVVAYLVVQGAPITYLPEFQRRYTTIYMKHYKRREIRAVSRIYFWWIQKCYPLSCPSGIRMAYRNLQAYETMCAL